ncbi:MAG: hypothetical protein NVS2B7_04400 [Herpetosiphon sp.]
MIGLTLEPLLLTPEPWHGALLAFIEFMLRFVLLFGLAPLLHGVDAAWNGWHRRVVLPRTARSVWRSDANYPYARVAAMLYRLGCKAQRRRLQQHAMGKAELVWGLR